MRRFSCSPVILAGVLIGTCACAHNPKPPTAVASVADVGARIEASAGALLQQAQTAQATVNPATGKAFISRGQLDAVAIAVDRVGRLGLDLSAALRDYTAVKTGGGDPAAMVVTIQKIIADLTQALSDLGQQLPAGTVGTIDATVATILSIIAQVKTGVGL